MIKEKRIVATTCSYDCGSRCILNVQVVGGRVKRIYTDARPEPGLRACPKGLLQGDVVHAPDRLTQPLKRVGKRGKGEFTPITWDEALDKVAGELHRIKELYGNEAIMAIGHSGSVSPLHGTGKATQRFFSFFGGCTSLHGNASLEAAAFSSQMTFGNWMTGSSKDNFLHSRLIILWGWNPLATRFGCDTAYYLERAKAAGTRIVCVDPRKSLTARTLADQWIPVRPGTDAALLIAMAYVIISENLHDKNFIESHVSGFEAFRDYVMGKDDGMPKTPGWAENITGVASDITVNLARAYATEKPAALYASWAPGRSAFGEQYHRAASALAAITGNMGILGGHASGGTSVVSQGFLRKSLPVPRSATPGRSIHLTRVYDTLGDGSTKLLYLVGCNLLNQFLNLNKGLSALQVPEFIIIHELFMTPTARYADLVLPAAHFLEKEDIGQPWGGGPYFLYAGRVLDTPPEVKSDLAIFSELASRLGIPGHNDKTEDDWLREFWAATPGLPEYDEFKREGRHEISQGEPLVAFRSQISDPLNHPFPTPSGKIEIYSQKMAQKNNPLIPPIPMYIASWEGPSDPLVSRYPIQLISPHSRGRVNSTFDNIPKLKAIADDTLWINPADAESRRITEGDTVRVFNDRGCLVTRAKVTDDIMPGVASLDAGAWYRPDANGVDWGGSVNVLTRDARSPGGAFACNTILVEIAPE
jgi:anaerobic dimethyl sulfoxide reductase subunit A